MNEFKVMLPVVLNGVKYMHSLLFSGKNLSYGHHTLMMVAMISLKYWLLFREKTAIYCEDYAKHKNELDRQNIVFDVKADGRYCLHCAFKG